MIGAVVLLLGCVVGGGITAIAGANSESDGVAAAGLTVLPIGFGLAATLVAIITRKKQKGVAIGAPIGCGCLGGIGAAIAFFVFMTAIWPSL